MATGWMFGIIAASLILMLVRPHGIAEAWWIGGGVVLLLLTGLVPLSMAGHAFLKGTDVYFFLTGMMLLAELGRSTGIFDALASYAVGHARGSSSRLFALVYGIGVVVTALLSNDATAVVLTPAVLAAVKKAKAKPLPMLFACAMIANAASFLLPISNPANLVVYHGGSMPRLGQWMTMYLLPSIGSIVASFGVLRWWFRRELANGIEAGSEQPQWTREGKIVLGGLALTTAVLLISSAMRWDLGLPTLLAAATVVAVVAIVGELKPMVLLRDVSWSTLLLVAGLFVIVEAAEAHGALRIASDLLARAQAMGLYAGATVVAFVVGVGNNLVNNLPLGLLTGAALEASKQKGLVAEAALIAIDLGPNLSVTGSLATMLWLIALRREGEQVSFWTFLKVGAIAMPTALLASLGGLLVEGAVFGAR